VSFVKNSGSFRALRAQDAITKHRGMDRYHSHARCKLVEALNTGDSRAIEPLLLYTRLFAIEAESKALREDFDARLARRLVRSQPLVKE
jgi:hypothetical protein